MATCPGCCLQPKVTRWSAWAATGQLPQISVILMGEEDTNLTGQPLEEKDHKEDVVLLGGWAQFQRISEQLRRITAAEGLHGVQQLNW